MTDKHKADAPVVEPLGSVISYPKRCELFGSNRFRGNCDGRVLVGLIARYNATRIADPFEGSGTSRDVCTWLRKTHGSALDYWGSDLTQGFDCVEQNLPGERDLVFAHVPYHDMIRYSDDPRDLSNCASYSEFLTRLERALRNCYRSLVPGGHLAVLCGARRKRGQYFPIPRDVQNFAGTIGELRSVVPKLQWNCESDSKQYGRLEDARILDESLVIFKKPAA